MSLTPAINLSPVSLTTVINGKFSNTSANFRNNSKRPQWNTQGPGGHWFMKKNLKEKISCQPPFNPLPHGGRTYWPITSLHANFSKSSEGKVSSKIRYSSSWILGLFWNHNSTYLGLNYPVFNFFVKLSKIGGHGWPPPWCHSLLINRYNIENSFTA